MGFSAEQWTILLTGVGTLIAGLITTLLTAYNAMRASRYEENAHLTKRIASLNEEVEKERAARFKERAENEALRDQNEVLRDQISLLRDDNGLLRATLREYNIPPPSIGRRWSDPDNPTRALRAPPPPPPPPAATDPPPDPSAPSPRP